MKQHLAGGFADVAKCPKTTEDIRKEVRESLMQGMRNNASRSFDILDDDEDDSEHNHTPINLASSSHQPSSGTAAKSKRAQSMLNMTQALKVEKQSKSVAAMIRKTPEEVVEERHAKGRNQTTIERFTKSKEEIERTHLHVANFFYECGIPFNAANQRSFEIMYESIGQLGPGSKPPSFHDLREPLLQKSKKDIDKLKEMHVQAWKKYGCTLMADGWTDRRSRHLINFLVNSPDGTFFLESIDALSQTQDADMLAAVLMEKIEQVGKEYVVQVVTDNGANFKKAGKLLEERMPTLFWTPCAAHCLDLMLEDIGKVPAFKSKIDQARHVTTFIYRHVKLLSAMREKTGGRDLVRAGVTRFATSFLTLQSLCKNKDALRKLFVSEDWTSSKLASTAAGQKVYETIFSTRFWSGVENCIRAAHPLMIVLRIVDGDEKPALPELAMAMREARKKINESFANNASLLVKLVDIIESRWEDQMEVKLYGAALFLNPSKYFDLKKDDLVYALEVRATFNDVLMKMIVDPSLLVKISDQADDYEEMRGNFAKELAIRQQKTKSPLDWWRAFGGRHVELFLFAIRLLGLCCSSSGCERNWSTFEFIHTKRRNRLEHKRLNDLVYVQYNRKIANRFQKRREEGDNFNPLVLEDFHWDNEWVNKDHDQDIVHPEHDLLWSHVDTATGASANLVAHNTRGTSASNEDSSTYQTYTRRRSISTSRMIEEDSEEFPNDDEDIDEEDDHNDNNDDNPSDAPSGDDRLDDVYLDEI